MSSFIYFNDLQYCIKKINFTTIFAFQQKVYLTSLYLENLDISPNCFFNFKGRRKVDHFMEVSC